MKNLLKNLLKKIFFENNRTKYFFCKLNRFLCTRGVRPFWIGDQSYRRWKKIKYPPDYPSYVEHDGSVDLIFFKLQDVLKPSEPILEVGCNAGRILEYLRLKGFQSLYGLEINESAVHTVMKHNFPELHGIGKFVIGEASQGIQNFKDDFFQLVYAHSVLIHVSPKQKKLFSEMVRVSQKYIAVLSQDYSLRDFSYDFQRLFENLGCKEIHKEVFYNQSWLPSSEAKQYRFSRERYDEKRDFLNTWSLRIFVKKVR